MTKVIRKYQPDQFWRSTSVCSSLPALPCTRFASACRSTQGSRPAWCKAQCMVIGNAHQLISFTWQLVMTIKYPDVVHLKLCTWDPSSLAIVFSSPISSCCMLAPTTLSSSSMSLIFFSAPSAIVLPLEASDSIVASFLEMSSNLFSESERVALLSESCLSRLSMAYNTYFWHVLDLVWTWIHQAFCVTKFATQKLTDKRISNGPNTQG